MTYDNVHEDRLDGYTAIVTGGAGVIGTGTSVRLAREGANVVIAQRTAETAERVVDRIMELGGTAHYVPTDLNDDSDIVSLVDGTVDRFGGLHIVVNNAANQQFEWAESMSGETWDDMITTNLKGPFRLAQLAYPHMKADGFGRIINIGAIQGRSPLPGSVAYATSKAGLDGLTRSLASEWSDSQDSDITANTVLLGPIYEKNDPRDFPERPIETVHETVPPEADDNAATLVARWGRSSDVAALIAFLAAPESGFITAAIIPCDGGRLVSRKEKAVPQEDLIGE